MTASILMGVGIGGFVGGIVLHQILQRHNMVYIQASVSNRTDAEGHESKMTTGRLRLRSRG